MKEGENFPPQPKSEQLELGVGQYEKILQALNIFIKQIPRNEITQTINDKWVEIESEKLTDGELQRKLQESKVEDWKADPAYYYALISEIKQREDIELLRQKLTKK